MNEVEIQSIDLTPLREAEARALAMVQVSRKINQRIQGLGTDTQTIMSGVENLIYAQTIVLLYSELNLDLFSSYLHIDGEMILEYKVGSEGLEPIVPLMRRLREDCGVPRLEKFEMTLKWIYTHGGKMVSLRLQPGSDAKCERVVVGHKPREILSKGDPIYEVQCEGAEDFGEVMGQSNDEISAWEESNAGDISE